MNPTYRFGLLAALLLCAGTGFAQSLYFRDVSETKIPSTEKQLRTIVPTRYRTVVWDNNALQPFLRTVPGEKKRSVNASESVLALPMPDGGVQRFRLVECTAMAPELAAKFPGIKTYRGAGIDDPAASVSLTWSEGRFQAAILSPKAGWSYVAPYSRESRSYYMAFTAAAAATTEPMPEQDLLEEAKQLSTNPLLRATTTQSPPFATGDKLRIYRLAMACTHQYVRAIGATTKAQVIAHLVAIVNQINAIYLRDLAVRFDLVANNDELVFFTADEDWFTSLAHGNRSRMMIESQAVIDKVIGSANYDIGHSLDNTPFGGLTKKAGVLCEAGNKASAVSGTANPNPANSSFILIIAHEMGHEMGADHTFNAVTGSCFGQRRNQSNVEPGSGSTIMGYPGTCGINSLQAFRDPYFHIFSSVQMSYFQSLKRCGTTQATGNAVIALTSEDSYAIPASTPFVLSGTANRANLQYTWEQIDFGGNSHNWNTPAGDPDAALFRSFSPGNSSSRTFPRMETVIANKLPNYIALPIGEWLPDYSRNLRFLFTARDSRGSVTYKETAVTVDGNAGPFTLTYPNTALVWFVGEKRVVTWNVAKTDNVNGVNCQKVDIELSLNGGRTFTVSLKQNVANTGSAEITVPDKVCAVARVRVKAHTGNETFFFDISDYDFFILPKALPRFTVTCPNNTVITGAKDSTGTCTARINWPEPSQRFPEKIYVPSLLNSGILQPLEFMGEFGGHGYYQSAETYLYPEANGITNTLSDLAKMWGHLATVQTAEENEFLRTKLKFANFSSWIGLANYSGKPGAFQFGWESGEPFNRLRYHNWAPGEPNNLLGLNQPVVYEPWVAFSNATGQWSDEGETYKARFFAEFEGPLINYKRIGNRPLKNSVQQTGVYNICYEATNRLTGQKDTCCFAVTIKCDQTPPPVTHSCPKDTSFTVFADASGNCTGKTTIAWTAPTDSVLSVAQISGPANGSSVGVGTYTVCYRFYLPFHEVHDTVKRKDDTCCFKVAVVCKPAPPVTVACPRDTIIYATPLPNKSCSTALAYVAWPAPTGAGIFYQQTSGIPNGTTVPVGNYSICYQAFKPIHDSFPRPLGTCCFNITVLCKTSNSLLLPVASTRYEPKLVNPAPHRLFAWAYPNPSHNDFAVQVSSQNIRDKITVIAADLLGRIVEVQSGLLPNQVLSLGRRYRTGLYVLQIIQGNERYFLKLEKQGR